MGRSFSEVTYRSLCPPDDISDRGLDFVPNFYYRDDSFKLWNIINRSGWGSVEWKLTVLAPRLRGGGMQIAEVNLTKSTKSSIQKTRLLVFTRYVTGMVKYFYPSDTDVRRDTELQDWIKEIFTYSFLGKKATGTLLMCKHCINGNGTVSKWITAHRRIHKCI